MYQFPVPAGIVRILVGRQPANSLLDQSIQALGIKLHQFHGLFIAEHGFPLHWGSYPYAAQAKGSQVHLHRDAIEFDGVFQGFARNGNQTLLPGNSQEQAIGADGMTQQVSGDTAGGYAVELLRPGSALQGSFHSLAVKTEVRITGEGAGGRHIVVVHHR